MSNNEMTDLIKEVIKYIPCFYCIDGYLDLKKVEFSGKINATVYCEACDTHSEMQFDL